MVSVCQRSADSFVRYAIVDADRQGVTGPLNDIYRSTADCIVARLFITHLAHITHKLMNLTFYMTFI